MKEFKNLFVLVFLLGITIPGYTQTGIIYIKSNPQGAEVFINGEDTHKTTPYQQSLSPGSFTFSLQLELYKRYEGKFAIAANSVENLNIPLKPNFGSLRINSNPSGGECYLDGKLVGKTPLMYEKVISGSHKVELRLERFNTITDIIGVEDVKTTEKIYSFAAGFGNIGIQAKPAADIYINGKKVASQIYSGRIDAGEYSIEIRKENYISQVKKIVVEKGEDYLLNFGLIPLTGSLSVLSNPPEALISLNDSLYGSSPQIINNLKIGEYRIKLSKPGYRLIEQQVTINENNTTSIDVKMLQGELISINTQPDSVKVTVDRELNGIAPIDLLLKKGEHVISLSKKGFQNKDTVVNVTSDKKMNFILSRAIEQFTLNTNPSGAKVSLNQQKFGITPLNTQVQSGNYSMFISKKGFKPIDKTIEIIDPVSLNFDLVPENTKEPKIRKKSTAVIYSLIFPGAGQSYLMRKPLPLLLGVASYGALAGSVIMNRKAVENYDNYLTDTDPDKRASLKSQWETQSQLSRSLAYGAAGLWAINMIWVLIMPDEVHRNKNVSLHGYSNPSEGDSGLSLAISF